MAFHRRNQTILGKWWWTVDRLTLSLLAVIILLGAFLVATASPAVAERIGLEPLYFVHRQVVFLALAVPVMLGISLLSPKDIRRLAALAFALGIMSLIVVLIIGSEAKGARRWLFIGGLSIQPSEFVKPVFAVMTAWALARKTESYGFPGYKVAFALYGIFVALLVLQPDFGMTVTVSAVWGAQLFLAGLPLIWILIAALGGIIGIAGAYIFLPHVAKRINTFLDPTQGDTYQVQRSMEAFSHGGLAGVGPGEGTVKLALPDSHTDFIFAVAGEEMGAITCFVIILLFACVVLRGFIRMQQEQDLFVVYAVSGLLMQFGVQATINMGVALHLFPTKGMTLPFISYGGSSMLAIALGMGMVLGLTRRRFGTVRSKWVGAS